MQPHEIALKQWSNLDGVCSLLELWDYAQSKTDAEAIVAEMFTETPKHGSVVELGCGAGRLIAGMKEMRKYLGIDLSPDLLAVARERYADDKRVKFIQANFTEIEPTYKRPVDVVVCVHVARHYADPLAVLWAALDWPAKHYLFSVLHSPGRKNLLNGVSVATQDLDDELETLGIVLASREQPIGDEMSVRYFVLEPFPRDE